MKMCIKYVELQFRSKWIEVSYECAFETNQACECKPVFVVARIPNSKNPFEFKTKYIYFFLHRVESNKIRYIEHVLILLPLLLIGVLNSNLAWKCARIIHDPTSCTKSKTHITKAKKWILRSCTWTSIYIYAIIWLVYWRCIVTIWKIYIYV